VVQPAQAKAQNRFHAPANVRFRMAHRSRTNISISRKSTAGSRAIWKGSIDFGLVNIPARPYSVAASSQMNFDTTKTTSDDLSVFPIGFETLSEQSSKILL
jgi:hypothetical protein